MPIVGYEVAKPLPNVTFDVGRMFAGNVPIQRGPDLSLFYWAVESTNGSLTSNNTEAPWHIWLNGLERFLILRNWLKWRL
jgi:carboxypeptidase D